MIEFEIQCHQNAWEMNVQRERGTWLQRSIHATIGLWTKANPSPSKPVTYYVGHVINRHVRLPPIPVTWWVMKFCNSNFWGSFLSLFCSCSIIGGLCCPVKEFYVSYFSLSFFKIVTRYFFHKKHIQHGQMTSLRHINGIVVTNYLQAMQNKCDITATPQTTDCPFQKHAWMLTSHIVTSQYYQMDSFGWAMSE